MQIESQGDANTHPPEWLSVSVRVWECKLVQLLEETVWRFHMEVNTRLLCVTQKSHSQIFTREK